MEPQLDSGLESEGFFTVRELPAVPARSRIPLHGNCRIARESDIQAYLNPSEDEGHTLLNDVSFLLESADGRSLRGVFKHPFYMPAEIRRRNVLVIGQTGARKTQDHIIPMAASDISRPCETVVIVDGKGDLYQKLSPLVERYRPGTRISVINLTNRKRTTRAWNPYCANLDSRSALEDAQSFCAASQTRAYSYDSPFWDGSAARWIAGLMFRLRAKQGSVCPADVHEALELPRSDLLALLKGGANVPFAAAVASFLESGSQNAETVLATAQMYYRIFQNLDIASVTSADEFWFETLFKPTVLILEISQCDAEQVRPLLNLFFSQLFREAARYAETQPGCRLAIPLNLYMDDFAASLGRIPEMGQHLNLSRSRDIRVVAAIQSLSQIDHFYGSEAGSVISGFSTYIVKSPVSQSDAEWASAHSGTMTVESIDMNQNLDPNYVNGWETVSRTIHLIGRRVLLPEDIRLAPEHFLYGRASTVILPDVPVFQAWFRPAFDQPELAQPMAMAAKKPRRKSLRRRPLEWKSRRCVQILPPAAADCQFTNTRYMDGDDIRARLEEVKDRLGWPKTEGFARVWWQAFEDNNRRRMALVLRLTEALASRNATITEFVEAYDRADTDNLEAALFYFDYLRLRKKHQRNRQGSPSSNHPED